jgi:hypothetical protein
MDADLDEEDDGDSSGEFPADHRTPETFDDFVDLFIRSDGDLTNQAQCLWALAARAQEDADQRSRLLWFPEFFYNRIPAIADAPRYLAPLSRLFLTVYSEFRDKAIDHLSSWFKLDEDHQFASIFLANYYIEHTKAVAGFELYFAFVLSHLAKATPPFPLLQEESHFLNSLFDYRPTAAFLPLLIEFGFLNVKEVFQRLGFAPRAVLKTMFSVFKRLSDLFRGFRPQEELRDFVNDSLFVVFQFLKDPTIELHELIGIGRFLKSVTKLPIFRRIEVPAEFLVQLSETVVKLFDHEVLLDQPYAAESLLKGWAALHDGRLNEFFLSSFVAESERQSAVIVKLCDDETLSIFEAVGDLLASTCQDAAASLASLLDGHRRNVGVCCLLEISASLLRTRLKAYDRAKFMNFDRDLLDAVCSLCNEREVDVLDEQTRCFEAAVCHFYQALTAAYLKDSRVHTFFDSLVLLLLRFVANLGCPEIHDPLLHDFLRCLEFADFSEAQLRILGCCGDFVNVLVAFDFSFVHESWAKRDSLALFRQLFRVLKFVPFEVGINAALSKAIGFEFRGFSWALRSALNICPSQNLMSFVVDRVLPLLHEVVNNKANFDEVLELVRLLWSASPYDSMSKEAIDFMNKLLNILLEIASVLEDAEMIRRALKCLGELIEGKVVNFGLLLFYGNRLLVDLIEQLFQRIIRPDFTLTCKFLKAYFRFFRSLLNSLDSIEFLVEPILLHIQFAAKAVLNAPEMTNVVEDMSECLSLLVTEFQALPLLRGLDPDAFRDFCLRLLQHRFQTRDAETPTLLVGVLVTVLRCEFDFFAKQLEQLSHFEPADWREAFLANGDPKMVFSDLKLGEMMAALEAPMREFLFRWTIIPLLGDLD